MRVILLADVKNLGIKGEVVRVAQGYARNYLLPLGLAMEATEGRMKQVTRQKADAAKKKQREEEKAREFAARLNGVTVRVYSKAGKSGKLFGSINNKDIAEALQKESGVEVDKRKVILKEPLKQTGMYSLTVKLHPSVEAQIYVHVLAEQ